MSYFAAFLTVAFSAGAAAAATWLVDRYFGFEIRRRHHDVGGLVFLQLGVMFSVLLAFVFSEVWSEYNTAAFAINGECGALHGAAILSSALPDAAGRPVERAIAAYTKIVVDTEWPMMAQRQRSPAAIHAIEVVFRAAVALSATRPTEVSTEKPDRFASGAGPCQPRDAHFPAHPGGAAAHVDDADCDYWRADRFCGFCRARDSGPDGFHGRLHWLPDVGAGSGANA